MTNEKSLRESLIAAAKAGRLLKAVHADTLGARGGERDDLVHELAMLHNEGLLDVVVAFEDLKNNAPGGPDFFLTRRVFEQALPYVNASVAPVMQCVLELFHAAGQDMVAGTIFNAYIEFCTKDAARPRDALKLIESHPAALADLLAATIAAGSQLDNPYYLAELLRLIRHPDIEVRRRAVFSVSTIHWPKGERVSATAIAALEEAVAAENNDRILASAIKSSFALFRQDKTLEERVVTLIEVALSKGDEEALHTASELLWLGTKELPVALLHLLLRHLKQVKPENIGTLNNVDLGIAHLLKRDEPEQGLRFLEELLVTHKGRLNIKVLDGAAAEIRQSPALLSKVLTRWLLRNERALHEAVHEIAGTHYGGDLGIEIDPSELEPADHVHILFTARKAIGYFFMKPVTVASAVISLMRYAPDDDTVDALGQLLLDPLLLNYPGGMRDYVKEQADRESGMIKEAIENALTAIEQYLEVLCSVPELPALHPGQSQRETYRRHMSESMTKSMKAAEKTSIFHNLFARSTLLYGNKSINYIFVGDGEPRRMEIPLSNHGVSMEFPRMDNIDPYGLDYMLRVFRQERLRE